MRPVVPDPFVPRPRKPSTGPDGAPSSASTEPAFAAPETFFLAKDEDMENSSQDATATAMGECPTTTADSSYGIQSLEESSDSAVEASSGVAVRLEDAISQMDNNNDNNNNNGDDGNNNNNQSAPSIRRINTIKPPDLQATEHDTHLLNTSPLSRRRNRTPSDAPISLPLTPLTLGSPAEPSSLQSSPKSTSAHSFRPFDDVSGAPAADGVRSHSAASGNDEAAIDSSSSSPFFSSKIRDSAPQLIMPSIKMPSRRPFTDKGKTMGRFKVLVAGSKGIWFCNLSLPLSFFYLLDRVTANCCF